MSNIDKMTANEELFTELTPEEGAVVEGGADFGEKSLFSSRTLTIDYLYAKNPVENDPMIYLGKRLLTRHKDVKPYNFVFTKDIVQKFSNDATLSLWDEDFGTYPDDDLLGSVRLSGPTGGYRTLNAGGYIMRYKVT
ncbi:MAG: hypothetical protein QNJ41_29580 [Xenococcaceae cyanobacterium MO_188.B32]|nr:hypothetical protein [Xenococcaceae cyanobacterium MO_188.B32]